ncbi:MULTISPECIES: FMN-binding protein [unclassified Salinibacterium]|uniref:FMN-binding protein n=1 Tax=unclassified Salinibacterium TaxID=2632331 RepID=UPI0018CF9B9E|nr:MULTISPECIES: FMN-binding protein [unclassified Salinibacterium]MBH0055093.1 FMN-binding protein [Salinibacterium sp. SWN139]MBH0083755.1 FMN-binding protein [Salinibacterium sp. SWN167]
MRTRAILGSILASTSVLIVGYQAGVSVTTSDGTSLSLPVDAATNGTAGGTNAGTDATTDSSTGSTSSSTPGSDTAAAAPTTAGPADGTYTGSSVSTRFGNVQVAVTIASGSITDVTALQLTDEDGRSVQISNRAAPILRSEVLSSQSAQVSNVSGATYTTDAYLSSLQSALDQAGA